MWASLWGEGRGGGRGGSEAGGGKLILPDGDDEDDDDGDGFPTGLRLGWDAQRHAGPHWPLPNTQYAEMFTVSFSHPLAFSLLKIFLSAFLHPLLSPFLPSSLPLSVFNTISPSPSLPF